MSRATFSQRLRFESQNSVGVYLRDDLEVRQQKQGEAILDINHSGSWVRGFEMVGGFVPFSIARAVLPFSPIYPESRKVPEPGTVSYDPVADAAFFYLVYEPNIAGLPPTELADLRAVSHSINPTVLYGLDHSGGLVWVKIPIADVSQTDRFLLLLRK